MKRVTIFASHKTNYTMKTLILVKGKPAIEATPDIEIELPAYFKRGDVYFHIVSEEKYIRMVYDKWEKSIKIMENLGLPSEFDMTPENLITEKEFEIVKSQIRKIFNS